ncbi:hypothetical protein [Chryseobacterium sp.]|uniref:hypothetical protein n=1 Tax=Chryseobacterium sp. TaxID=1871047 RepID=UPI0011C8F6CF|nr:hypothetical protein [Chryseobacterium sp.]TXF79613.1 hypothetical protein FUA25_04310 [Chryseobacterium sp.]
MKILNFLLILLSVLISSQGFKITVESFKQIDSKLFIAYSIQNALNQEQNLVLNPSDFETYYDPEEYSYSNAFFSDNSQNLFAPRVLIYDENDNIVEVFIQSLESPIDSVFIKREKLYNELIRKRKDQYLPLKNKLNKSFGWVEVYKTINDNIHVFKPLEKKEFEGCIDIDKFIYDEIFRSNETFQLKDNHYYYFSLKIRQDEKLLREFVENKKLTFNNLSIESPKKKFFYNK